MELEKFMNGLVRRNPGQPEFHQAVREVAEKIIPFINKNPKYKKAKIFERMTEPDRLVVFRVCWEDDKGNVRVNRGYRVQFNNSIGPYKGGLRFDKSVSLSILKFLGFEQIFKNSLTTLPIGAAKGGANFNPKGKSDNEVMRFCQAFMIELSRHIGSHMDVPAGDIGVGAREIGYLFGQYKRLTNEFTGVLTGKGLDFSGSPIRTEATGYGCVYFAQNMLQHNQEDFEGKKVAVSGSGNVAQYAAEKVMELGGKVITLSDRGGFIYKKEGLTKEELQYLMELKNVKRGSLDEFATEYDAEYHKGKKPWSVACDVALPCATQNEMSKKEVETLLSNGCSLIAEGANMPVESDGIKLLENRGVLYAPGKASNAGGVAISALEMTQNSMRYTFSREEVDKQLKQIMGSIHEKCVEYGKEDGHINYVKGANLAGFIKVANGMLAYGIV